MEPVKAIKMNDVMEARNKFADIEVEKHMGLINRCLTVEYMATHKKLSHVINVNEPLLSVINEPLLSVIVDKLKTIYKDAGWDVGTVSYNKNNQDCVEFEIYVKE